MSELLGTLVKDYSDTRLAKTLTCSYSKRSSGTPSNFRVEFNLKGSVKSIKLINASIPNTMFNVSAIKGNSTFRFVDSVDGELTAVLADGQYSTASIMAALKTKIEAIPLSSARTITIGQDAITNKIYFFLSGGNISIKTVGDATYPNPMATVLGITSNAASTGGSIALAANAASYPNLIGEYMFHIESPDLLSNGNHTGIRASDPTGTDSTFLSIPVTVPWLSYQHYNGLPHDKIIYGTGASAKELDSIQIIIKGHDGRELTEIPTNYDPVIQFEAYLQNPFDLTDN